MRRDIRDSDLNIVEAPDEPIIHAALSALKPSGAGDGIVPSLDELSYRREIETILDRVPSANDLEARGKIRTRYRIAAAIAVAAACALLSVILIKPHAPSAETASKIPHASAASAPKEAISPLASDGSSPRRDIPGSRFALLFGDVSLEDGNVIAGSPIPVSERIRTKNGKIALSLPTGIAVGLSENASARVLWNGKQQYGVSLINGTALFSVDPSKTREGFFVETPAGTIRVTGTLFSVMVSPEDGVFVKVHRGRVIVERPDGRTDLMEGAKLTPLGQRKTALAALDDRIEKQLKAIRSIDDGSLFTELARMDGPAFPKTVTGRPAGGKFASDLSIQDLMTLARTRKASGNWKGAVSSYTELFRLYPDSDEARTSRVSVGQIYLHHLNNPEAALTSFDAYLHRQGPLTQEALYGRARALRVLGDRLHETEALRSLLDAYPTGVYAEAIRNRLSDLQ